MSHIESVLESLSRRVGLELDLDDVLLMRLTELQGFFEHWENTRRGGAAQRARLYDTATPNSDLDPISYLQETFPNAPELLLTMAATHTVISGSRALNYFVRGMCTEYSDWDFFVPASTLCIGTMIKRLEDQGVVWASWDRDQDLAEAYYTRTGFHVISGRRENTKVQLIWAYEKTAFEQVASFHSTIVQCLITGFGAICMYPQLTLQMKSWYWALNDTSSRKEERASSSYVGPRQKYVGRGIEYVRVHPTPEAPKRRFLGDPCCRIISFGGLPDLKLSYTTSEARILLTELFQCRWREHVGWPDDYPEPLTKTEHERPAAHDWLLPTNPDLSTTIQDLRGRVLMYELQKLPTALGAHYIEYEYGIVSPTCHPLPRECEGSRHAPV